MNLWTDIFQRDLNGEDPMQNFRNLQPGLLVFRGWSLDRQLSPQKKAYIDGLRNDIEAARKRYRRNIPTSMA